MGRIKYLFERILTMNYRGLFETVGKLHKKTGRSSLWLFGDVIQCGIRYGAGYKDYELCEFYNLTDEQRATYVTRAVNNRIVQLLNDPDYYHYVDDKNEFNRLYAPYIHRAWLDMTTASFEAFQTFIEKLNRVISKPIAACCGQGIEIVSKKDFPDLRQMFDHLHSIQSGLIEEVIVQHPDIAVIYPHSVNTYRIVTVLHEGQANVVYAFIRIGNGGRFVDNINAGGMAAPIDLDTGIIQYAAFDKNSNYYETHPYTGHPIVGCRLPFWKEALEMCLAAAHVVPQLGYIGWDIAVTENGPQLIEGNEFPGHDILQMPPHVPDKIGMLPKFKQFIPEL